MSGQSIQDRIQAARHSIAGQGLAKAVCKATTEEVMGPKKKHLDYLIQCTNEPNVSIPQLANLLIERTQHTNWVVVYKTLVTIHNLMNYGNERFTQYLASNNCTLNLAQFLDKTGVQGYDMSTYIRRYAKYINEKAFSYRQMAFDFCKVKRGKDDGLLRTMDAEKLLKTLPILQQQLDALLEFDVTANELVNGVVNACFMILFKDLIRLFACYNDGIINLLERFFDMNKKNASQAFEIYKKFLVRMDRCSEFLRVAESVGIDKGDIPDLAKAPSSLLQALEEHLKSMDSNKKPKDRSKVSAAIQQLQSPTSPSGGGGGISEADKKKILDEEKAQLEQLKEQALRTKAQSPTGATPPPMAANNPFGPDNGAAGAAVGATAGGMEDLFGAPAPATQAAGYGYDQDLLGLGIAGENPFGAAAAADNNPFGNTAPAASASPWGPPATAASASSSTATVTNGTSTSTSNAFISEDQFDKAFGNANSASTGMGLATSTSASGGPPGFDAFGDLLKPQNKSKGPSMASMQSPSKQADNKPIVKGDLDSSLANLAGNLAINGPASATKSGLQWNPNAGEKKMTGGSTWGGGANVPFTAASTAPMAYNGMTTSQYGMPVQQHQQQQQQQQQFYGAPPQGAYVANGSGGGPWSSGMGQQPMMATGFPPSRSMPMMGAGGGMQSTAPTTAPMFPQQGGAPSSNANDPFGAL